MPPSRKRPAEDDGYDDSPGPSTSRNNVNRRRQQSSEEPDSDTEARSSGEHIVKKFVRYALACEYARQPIRREAVREKVFGKHKAPWKRVFEETQLQLREKFGMELVELPLKERHTLKERQAQKSAGLQSSGTFVLATVLPQKFRVPAVLPPISAPSESTEASYVALYTTIISLIYLSGGTLVDGKLERYLRRLNADVNMPMDKTEAVLQKMIKQGYLVKSKERAGDDEIIEWLVGPRGKIEVGPGGVQGLVTTVYGENADDDLQKRINKSLGLNPPAEVAEAAEDEE